MCVILEIEPGREVPDDKMAIACDVNKHGYGVAYVDNREIKIIRSLTENDPTQVQKLLADLKSYRRFVHLRHATVGKVTMENNHPMVSLHGNKGRAELAFMHNGTLGRYQKTGDDRSDTWFFNEHFVKPLAERCAAFTKPKDVLDDPLFQCLVRQESATSLLLFFDAFGKTLRVGQWEEYEGFWASNKYSFQASHNRATRTRTNVVRYNRDHGWHTGTTVRQLPWVEVPDRQDRVGTAMQEWHQTQSNVVNLTANPADVVKSVPFSHDTTSKLPYMKEVLAVKRFLAAHTYPEDHVAVIKNLKIMRTSVLESLKQPDFSFLRNLTTDDLNELLKTYPAVMAEVVMELVARNAVLEHQNNTQAKAIIDLSKDKAS